MDLADTLLTAIEDCERLTAWAAPNAIAREDVRVDTALRRALDVPVPAELAIGIPLMRFANTDLAPLPLLEAIMSDTRPNSPECDLCGNGERSVSRLLVQCGASAVAVYCCFVCRATLDRPFARASVHWD